MKCMKEEENTYLFKIKSRIKPDTEILKVLDTKCYKKENVDKYLSAIRKLNDLKSEYLMEYLLIKESNGYIYLIMPEYYGSLNDYDLNCFLYSIMLRGIKRNDDEIKDKCYSESIYGFLRDILNGLKVIHENGYCHGNVCYSNIFAAENSFILSDYCLYLLDEEKFRKRVKYNKEKKEKDGGKIYDNKKIIEIIEKVMSQEYDSYDYDRIVDDTDSDYYEEFGISDRTLRETSNISTLINQIDCIIIEIY